MCPLGVRDVSALESSSFFLMKIHCTASSGSVSHGARSRQSARPTGGYGSPRPKLSTMRNIIRIPNFLGERNIGEMESRCVTLFAAVAVEKDPQRRFKLHMQRDTLRLELLRLRNDMAKAAQRRGLLASPAEADSPCCAREDSNASRASAAIEIPWYCRTLGSDDPKSGELPIDVFARKCSAEAKKRHLDRADLFADALANFAEDVRDYSTEVPTEEKRIAKRWNRAFSKAVHGMYARDFIEHNARERARLGDAYKKWTPRLSKEVAAVVSL